MLPFGRFPRADALLGPEMKSTGEVMGVAADYPAAFGKAQAAAGAELPSGGTVFISVTDGDKPSATQLAAVAARPRLHGARHRRHRPGDPPDGRARSSGSRSSARARRTWSSGSRPARSTS